MTLPLGPQFFPSQWESRLGCPQPSARVGGAGQEGRGESQGQGSAGPFCVCEFHPGAESKGQQGVRVGLSVLWGWPPYTCDLCFEV